MLRKFTDIIERDADKQVDKLIRKGAGGDVVNFGGKTVQDLEEEIRQEARDSVRTLEDVFGKAEAERCAPRKVPDHLIDTISFTIMLDPVIVCFPSLSLLLLNHCWIYGGEPTNGGYRE